jgi:hypothetical protein
VQTTIESQSSRIALRATGGLLVIAFLALATLVAMSPNRLLYDEPYFANYVSLLHRYGFTSTFLNSLNAAPGPLSAVIQLIFEPVTRLRPVAMRFVNVFLLVALVLVLVMWLKRGASDYWVAGGSVLVVPMTWVVAGMALSEMPAMFFVTLSLYLQLRGLEAFHADRPTLGWFLVAGICLGVAVWGRQPYLLLAGIPVLLAFREPRLSLSAVMFVCVSSALAIPLFVIWGGILPPSQHSAQEGISVVHGLTSLGYAGVCFILLAPRLRWLPTKVAFGLVAVTIIANASLGGFALYPIKPAIDRFLPVPMKSLYGNVVGSLFLSCGVVFMAVLLRLVWDERQDLERLAVNASLLLIAASPTLIAHQYSSRYTAMSLPYLILATRPWRQWRSRTLIMSGIGCGAGVVALVGHFFY